MKKVRNFNFTILWRTAERTARLLIVCENENRVDKLNQNTHVEDMWCEFTFCVKCFVLFCFRYISIHVHTQGGRTPSPKGRCQRKCAQAILTIGRCIYTYSSSLMSHKVDDTRFRWYTIPMWDPPSGKKVIFVQFDSKMNLVCAHLRRSTCVLRSNFVISRGKKAQQQTAHCWSAPHTGHGAIVTRKQHTQKIICSNKLCIFFTMNSD